MVPRVVALAASASLGLLPLLTNVGCGASSASSPLAPVATVEIPSPQAPEAQPSATPPAEGAEAGREPTTSDVKGTKTVLPETPPFVARFAAVFRTPASSAQPSFFGGDSIVLFTSPVTCDVAAVDQAGPPRLRVGVSWSAGQKSAFQQFVMKDGKATRHAGSIEILKAPANKGDVGRILIDAVTGANVTGGEIDALVCE